MVALAKAIAKATRNRWDPTRLYAGGVGGSLLLFDQPVRGGRGAVLDAAGDGASVSDSVVGVAAIEPGGLSPNLVTNGDFDTGTTGWTKTAGTVQTFSVTDGVLTLRGKNSALEIVNDVPLSLDEGQLFLLWFDFPESGNNANLVVKLGADAVRTGLTTIANETSIGSIGPILCQSPHSNPYLYLAFSGAAGDYIKADNVVVRALPGVGAIQASAALQPQRQQVDGYNVLRLDHVDDKLTLTFPDGLTGADVYIAGRNGSWHESGVTVAAGGTLDLGPKGTPGGTKAAVRALGDVVGAVIIERALTTGELALLTGYFKSRGAKSPFEEQLDSLVDFENMTVNGAGITFVDGEWVFDGTTTNSSYLAANAGLTPGELYRAEIDYYEQTFGIVRLAHPAYTSTGLIGGLNGLPGVSGVEESHFVADSDDVFIRAKVDAAVGKFRSLMVIPSRPPEHPSYEVNPVTLAGNAGAAFLFDRADRRAAARILDANASKVVDTGSVTIVSRPVGDVLDPEMVTNGRFEADVSSWAGLDTAGDPDATVLSWENGTMRVDSGGRSKQYVDGFVPGVVYEVSLDIAEIVDLRDGYFAIATASNLNGVDSVVARNSPAGHYRTFFKATQSYYYIGPRVMTQSTGFVRLDNISIRPYAEGHAYQPSSALLPTYSVDANGHGALAFDLVDDVMTAKFPSGFSGDIFFAGRNGCWIERDVAVAAGGTLDIGPRHGPKTGYLLDMVGALVGAVCVDHTISDSEKTRLRDFFMARGAKGMLVEGPELITTPMPTTTRYDEYVAFTGIVRVRASITIANSGDRVRDLSRNYPNTGYYSTAVGVEFVRDGFGSYIDDLGENIFDHFRPPASGGALISLRNDPVGGTINSLSVRELIPEEEL